MVFPLNLLSVTDFNSARLIPEWMLQIVNLLNLLRWYGNTWILQKDYRFWSTFMNIPSMGIIVTVRPRTQWIGIPIHNPPTVPFCLLNGEFYPKMDRMMRFPRSFSNFHSWFRPTYSLRNSLLLKTWYVFVFRDAKTRRESEKGLH